MTYGEAKLLHELRRPNPGEEVLYDIHVDVTFRMTASDLDEAIQMGARIGFVRGDGRGRGMYLFPYVKSVTAHPTNTSPYPVANDEDAALLSAMLSDAEHKGLTAGEPEAGH